MKLENNVFVVTGAGSGMGRELTLLLLKKGARVAAVDIDSGKLEETRQLANQPEEKISCFSLDITEQESVTELPGKIILKFGQVDAIINNAGIIQPFVPINDLTYDQIERTINVNFYGSLYMIKSFLPYLLTRPQAHIANVSSMGALVPVPGQVLYGASKAAIKLLTEGLASELAKTNINVSTIVPGAVGTNIASNSGVTGLPDMNDAGSSPKGMKILSASEAANIILNGIERNKPLIIVGKDARIMDILSRVAPIKAAKLINKKMDGLLKDKT